MLKGLSVSGSSPAGANSFVLVAERFAALRRSHRKQVCSYRKITSLLRGLPGYSANSIWILVNAAGFAAQSRIA